MGKPLSLRGLERTFGINREVARQAIDDGELTAYRIGERRFHVFPEDAEAFLRLHRVQPTAHAERVVEKHLQREAAHRGGAP